MPSTSQSSITDEDHDIVRGIDIEIAINENGGEGPEWDDYEWIDNDIFNPVEWLPKFTKSPGPKNLTSDITPIQLFRLYFDLEFLSDILYFTNRKAETKLAVKKSDKLFIPLTIEELEKFIGVQIYMCYHILPIEKDHWSTNPLKGSEPIQKTMGRDKYLKIKWNLSFYNKDQVIESDKVFKIRPLIDRVSQVARSMYQPNRELSIDESLVKFDGRFQHKVKIARKAAGCGIESINICEARSGYLLDWKLFTGTETTDMPKTEQTCVDLLKNLGDVSGHHIYTDNFYTSPSLALRLACMGVGLTGTVRHNRKGLPSQLKSLNLNAKDSGPYYFRNGQGAGNLCVMAWCDTKPMLVMSSVYGN